MYSASVYEGGKGGGGEDGNTQQSNKQTMTVLFLHKSVTVQYIVVHVLFLPFS